MGKKHKGDETYQIYIKCLMMNIAMIMPTYNFVL